MIFGCSDGQQRRLVVCLAGKIKKQLIGGIFRKWYMTPQNEEWADCIRSVKIEKKEVIINVF